MITPHNLSFYYTTLWLETKEINETFETTPEKKSVVQILLMPVECICDQAHVPYEDWAILLTHFDKISVVKSYSYDSTS